MIEIGSNLARIAEGLRRLSQAIPKIVSGVLSVWGAQTADAIRLEAPAVTGNLEKSIDAESSETTPSVTIVAGAPYAGWVEWGTKPHVIEPRGMRHALRWPSQEGGGFAFAQRVDHPGTEPQPYFFGTIDGAIGDLDDMTSEALTEAIHRVGLDAAGGGGL